ncbi:HDL099Wp [Eremothecium sinecaudum]|uniref:HDL099Wp n=1 Tax=Eremothecium sinecaudum TaxID=45286 RepID=A0A0X8HSJ2_9SACH|nr:HDL099Wp [Eremothecium sinecaudum]AMD20645.1 HDL099Wp [Eremothecium sinecaudum]
MEASKETRLLHSPGLKFRLLTCIFSPTIILPALVYLISIFSVHFIQYSQLEDSGPSASIVIHTVISTSTGATGTVTATVTATATATATPFPENYLDLNRVNETLLEYVKVRVNNTIALTNTYAQGKFNDSVNDYISAWNESLYGRIRTQLAAEELMLSYNTSIHDNLEIQSERMKSTIDKISSYGFTVGSQENAQDLKNTLTIDRSFLASLFGAVADEHSKLKDFILPTLPRLQWTPLKSEEILPKLKQHTEDLLDALNSLNGNSTIFSAAAAVYPRNSARNRRKITGRLSAVVIAILLVTVLVLMLKEWFCFRLQNHVILRNVQTTLQEKQIEQAMQPSVTAAIGNCSFLIAEIQTLASTLQHTLAYLVQNLQFRLYRHWRLNRPTNIHPIHITDRRWQQISAWNIWYISSHAVNLWLSLFVIVTERLLISHLFKDATPVASLIVKRSAENPATHIAKLTDAFAQKLDTKLLGIINETLWQSANGTLSAATAVLQKDMQNLVSTVANALPTSIQVPNWSYTPQLLPITSTPSSNITSTLLYLLAPNPGHRAEPLSSRSLHAIALTAQIPKLLGLATYAIIVTIVVHALTGIIAALFIS